MTSREAYLLGARLAMKSAGLHKTAESILPAEALAATLKTLPDTGGKATTRFAREVDPKDPPDNMRWSKSGPHGYDTLTTMGLTAPDVSTYGL
jgi:hypothetical protein